MASRYGGRFLAANAPNPAKEPVPVYEQQWVLPHPTARIKILKWVKATNRPSRSFPESEDARYVYASTSNNQQQPSTSSATVATASNGSVVATLAPVASASAGPVAGADGDVVMDDSTLASGPGGVVMSVQEEEQGQHLFDETQVEPLVPTAVTGEESTSGGGGATATADSSMTPAMAVKIGEAAAEADQQAAAEAEDEGVGNAEAEADEDQEGVAEEEEEEEAVVAADLPQRHQTIRIGGPLLEARRSPPTAPPLSKTTAVESNPESEPHSSTISQADQPATAEGPVVVPTPQVESELHPPLDGIPPSDPLAEQQAIQQQQSKMEEPAAPPTADAIEADPASGVDTGDPTGEADNLGGVETVKRDDPEVEGLGEDVVAVVHAQPDGVESVKVVED